MAGEAPGLRPLTISERGISTLYGMMPAGVVMIAARFVFLLLHIIRGDVDITLWESVRYLSFVFDNTGLEEVVGVVRVNGPTVFGYDTGEAGFALPSIIGYGMYPVFYFSYGRTLGHMVTGAHIVHYRTGRRMRNWQKAMRGAAPLCIGLFPQLFPALGLLSVILVVADRRRRRSAYDWLAGTVVVVGEPAADEPETAKEGSRRSVLSRLTGRA